MTAFGVREHVAEIARLELPLGNGDRDPVLTFEERARIDDGDRNQAPVLAELEVMTFRRGVVVGRLPGLARAPAWPGETQS